MLARRGEDYVCVGLTSLWLVSCVGVVVSKGVLLSVCIEQPIVLAINWVVWDFYGNHLANNSVICDPILVQETSFGDKRWAVGVLSSLLFGSFI